MAQTQLCFFVEQLITIYKTLHCHIKRNLVANMKTNMRQFDTELVQTSGVQSGCLKHTDREEDNGVKT